MEGYPFVSAFVDRHGTTRFRFRRGAISIYLPKAPGDPQFEEHYRAAVEGRKPRLAVVKRHPKSIIPESFGDGWRLVLQSPEWKSLDASTQLKNERLAKIFLDGKIDEASPVLWRDVPVSAMRRKHIRMILAQHGDTPHKAKHMLTAIRRIFSEALDQDWIEFDPSLKIKWRPEYGGWRAWTIEERNKFEARWPNGSTPRAAYAMALWLGNRRSDVATQLWSDIDFERKRVTVRQEKGRRLRSKVLRLLLLPMLEDAIVGLPRRAETVLTTEYGKPFSEKSLTGMMAHWTAAAGIGPGCTFHGLRKTLGKYLAEEGATAKQAAGILGHDDLDHVELYSREAEQERLAVDGMERLLSKHGGGRV